MIGLHVKNNVPGKVARDCEAPISARIVGGVLFKRGSSVMLAGLRNCYNRDGSKLKCQL